MWYAVIPALTLWRPWTACFTAIPGPAAKRVENRSWTTRHRGGVYLHAGKRFDVEAVHLANRIWKQPNPHTRPGPTRVPPTTDGPILTDNPANYPTGVVAVAELLGMCTASLGSPTLRCDCGPWAFPGQAHWRFGDVRELNRPVPCPGAQQLWRLPNVVEADVRAQLGTP